ncbi:Ankyrin repeat domain-containing protein 44 [Thelotrema lepadinum]|nr:Ankyrin repeat domain-containing protein 44 [Thelotrema lepadinum]
MDGTRPSSTQNNRGQANTGYSPTFPTVSSFPSISALLAASPAPLGSRLRAADPSGLLLAQAARSDDVSALTALVDVAGFHPDIRPDVSTPRQAGERTPLSLAAGLGNQGAVAALLDRGADPERIDARGMTALHWAASEGWSGVVEILLEWYTCQRGERDGGVNGPNGTEAEKKLGRGKIAEDWMDGCGRTPLSWAAGRGHAGVVKLLLENSHELEGLGFALLDVEDCQGRTVLSWAAGNGHEDVVDDILYALSASDRIKALKGEEYVWWRNRLRILAKERNDERKRKTAAGLANLGLDLTHADRQGWTPLTWAVRRGHAAVVELLMDYGADPNVEDKYGRTPLYWAATEGYEDIVQVLLQNGNADPELEDKRGATPLSQAMYHGYNGVMELLEQAINKKKEPFKANLETLLWWAIKEGYAAVVASLLQSGANPDAQGDDEQRPLLWAAVKGDEAITNLLLSHSADTEVSGSWFNVDHGIPGYDYGRRRKPLSWAAGNGHLGAVKLLVENGANLEATENSNVTPLVLAAGNGHADVVNFLLQRGVNLQISKPGAYSHFDEDHDRWRDTPLKAAVKSNHLGIANQLVDTALATLGSDIHTEPRDIHNRSLLSWAAGLGHETAVMQLLSQEKFEVLVDSHDRDGRTPLSYASDGGHDAAVSLLLQKGANVDSPDKEKRTPLWFAASHGHESVAQQLLDHKADRHIAEASTGNTALQKAIANGHLTTVSLLISRGANVHTHSFSHLTPLSEAAQQGDVPVMNLLLSNGAKPDGEQSHPQHSTHSMHSSLGRAAGNGHLAAVTILLAHGATVDPPLSANWDPPLSCAAAGGHLAIVDLLLASPHSADPNWSALSYRYGGRPPLIAAAEGGCEDVVRRLLVCGAEVDARWEWEDMTALCCAARSGHEVVAKLLLEKGADVEPQWRDWRDGLKLKARDKWEGKTREGWGGRGRDEHEEGKRPIALAAEGGWVEIVRMLVERGAGLGRSQRLEEGGGSWGGLIAPLREAAQKGHEEVVRLLLGRMLELAMASEEGEGREETSRRKIGSGLRWVGWRDLWVREGKEGTVRALLEFGADPNSMNESGLMPLCETNSTTLSHQLLEAGALPDLGRDYYDDTALIMAAKSGKSEMARLLLEYKADTEIKNKDGLAPLLLAAKNGNMEVVRLLVEGGADVETEDPKGLTPLSWAGWNHHDSIVKYLIESHANLDALVGRKPSQDTTGFDFLGL